MNADLITQKERVAFASARNVTIVRALGGLGDVLCAIPALRQLRRALLSVRIEYVGLPQVAGAVERFPDLIDRFIEFPGFPGVVESSFSRERLTAFLDAQRGNPRPDLAIQMHGSGSVTNVFTSLLDARVMAGYYLPGLWRPAGCFSVFPEGLPEVRRWTALMDGLGFDGIGDALDFPVTDADRDALDRAAPGLRQRPYAVVHAGASDARRRWPAVRFARVGDLLATLGLQVVLTGTATETAIVAEVEAAMAKPAVNLCGRTSLGAAAALIERAHLVVTNDTGTSHLAAALRTPSIVIFIASDPARWAPLDHVKHRAVGPGIADIAFGSFAHPVDASLPDLDDVVDAVHDMMAVVA